MSISCQTSNAAPCITPQRRPRQFSLLGLLIAMAVLSVLLAIAHEIMTAYRDTMQITHRSICQGELKYLALALHNYHDVYGSFPPAYIADSTGKPMHSWRVLILPFMEEGQLYAAYNFNEPWNGPHNIQLASRMPRFFGCSFHERERARGITNYVAVTGPGTAWPGATCVSLPDITDDKDQTLLIAETEGSGICWLEPRDLEIANLPLEINPNGRNGISSLHRHGVNVATAAGYVHWLNENELTPDRLKALLTIAGRD